MAEPLNQPDWIAALMAALAGILGRVMFMTQAGTNPFSKALLWEIPTAIAMGWIGRGLGETAGLNGFPLFAIPIAVAYVGPGFITYAMTKYFGLKQK